MQYVFIKGVGFKPVKQKLKQKIENFQKKNFLFKTGQRLLFNLQGLTESTTRLGK